MFLCEVKAMSSHAGRYVYRNRENQLLETYYLARGLALEVLPGVGLFIAFCVVWAAVFTLALK